MAKAHKSRYAILGILANAPGSSGYDIHTTMKESTDFFWKESFSSIYPVLETLEKNKLITQLEASASGRKRKTYKITDKGTQVLQTWLMEDVELEQARNELLLKVCFGNLTSVSTSVKHIEVYKHQITTKKRVLESIRNTLLTEYSKHKNFPYWIITVEFGIRRLQASLEWSEYALDTLSKIKKKG